MSHTSLAHRAAIATLLITGSLFAASKDPAEAEMVVKGWLRANPRPLDMVLSDRFKRIETIRSDGGRAIGYVVQLRPEGFVVVSGDDLIEPIIAFAGDGGYDRSAGNPLWALISNDLQGRIA
ncbi:MAG: Spi family protease inhibitor, partial [Planctomycetota bacterium]